MQWKIKEKPQFIKENDIRVRKVFPLWPKRPARGKTVRWLETCVLIEKVRWGYDSPGPDIKSCRGLKWIPWAWKDEIDDEPKTDVER